MFDTIINRNLMFLQKYGVKMETEEDKDIYRYGLKILYSYIIDVSIIFSLASCFGRLYETGIMTLVFAILQVFGGGYHAKTKLKCSLLMIIGAVIGNILIMLLFNYPFVSIISSVIVSTVIFILVPITNEKHSVSKKTFRRSAFITRFIIALIVSATLLLMTFNRNIEMATIVTTLYLYFVSLVVAKFKNSDFSHQRK